MGDGARFCLIRSPRHWANMVKGWANMVKGWANMVNCYWELSNQLITSRNAYTCISTL